MACAGFSRSAALGDGTADVAGSDASSSWRIGRSEFGSETVLQLARVIGGSVALLAEAIVDAFRVRVEMPKQTAGEPYSEVVEDYSRRAPVLLSALGEALGDILRAHVLAVARSTWAPDAARAVVTRERTVGFADLVGYTRSAPCRRRSWPRQSASSRPALAKS